MASKLTEEVHCRCDEEFKEWVMQAAFVLDLGCSEFIRDALPKGYLVLKAEKEARDLVQNSRFPL